MIPDYMDSKKHDYNFSKERQLQNKLLAADDVFDQPKQTASPTASSHPRHSNPKDVKFCEVTGWCPDEKVALRRPEHDGGLSKPRTSVGAREYVLARDRSKKDLQPVDPGFSFHHYPESHRYIEQYRREHTCTDSTNSAAARNDFLELQRFYAYRNSHANSMYTHPTTVGYAPQSQLHSHTPVRKEPQSAAALRGGEPNLRSASRYKLSPNVHRTGSGDGDVSNGDTRESPLQVGASSAGSTSKMAVHAVSKTPIPKVPSKVTVPANASMISPGLNRTLKASTRKNSSPKSSLFALESSAGAVRTLDTLACVATPGDKDADHQFLFHQVKRKKDSLLSLIHHWLERCDPE